jgi:DNA-binding transcriptional regulator YhcF (GntR family)
MAMNITVRIDPDDPTPPYEQLRKQLAGYIIAGHLPAGERLAPVRQLAVDLDLATGTVARAYRELEAAGLVQGRRGGGTTVLPRPQPRSDARRRSEVRGLAEAYVASARLVGATDAAILAAVEKALTD